MLYDKNWDARPQVTEEPWREIYRRAADLIERHGLAKHIQRDPQGRLCLHGALSVAETGEIFRSGREFWPQVRRYLESQGVVYPPHREDSAWWNNAPERTQAEVVAALRGAAEYRPS